MAFLYLRGSVDKRIVVDMADRKVVVVDKKVAAVDRKAVVADRKAVVADKKVVAVDTQELVAEQADAQQVADMLRAAVVEVADWKTTLQT